MVRAYAVDRSADMIGGPPDETYDDRGPFCRACLDMLPIGHEGELCEECEADADDPDIVEAVDDDEI